MPLAKERKWVRFTAIVDHTVIYDLIEACEGKALAGSIDFKRVMHAGEEPVTGKLKQLPTGRNFVMEYARNHPGPFRNLDVCKAGEQIGLKKATISTAVNLMMHEGALQRIGVGIYQLAGTASAAAPQPTSKKKANKRQGVMPGEGTVLARVLDVLREKQNGTGEGVPLSVIKQQLGGKKATSGISPAINDLMERNLVERTSKSHYRAVAQSQ